MDISCHAYLSNFSEKWTPVFALLSQPKTSRHLSKKAISEKLVETSSADFGSASESWLRQGNSPRKEVRKLGYDRVTILGNGYDRNPLYAQRGFTYDMFNVNSISSLETIILSITAERYFLPSYVSDLSNILPIFLHNSMRSSSDSIS